MILESDNPHGGDIYRNKVTYDFSANVSPLETPKKIKEAIRNAAEGVRVYPDPYCSELRKAIATKENINIHNIICGNGASELIFSYALAVKPKRALIVSPTFCEYENALRICNCDIEYYDLKAANDFHLGESLCEHIHNSIDVVFLCNPNNPTGKAYDHEVMKKIVSKCNENEIKIFVDECFNDMSNHPQQYTLKEEMKKNRNIIILRAFTKSYGMAGIRLGYAMCSDSVVLNKMSQVTQTWNISNIAQAAGIAALECDSFVEDNRKIIHEERRYLTKSLRKLGIKVFDSDVNFILFQVQENSEQLYETLLKRGILIRKCDNFRGLENNFYRCAVKIHDENKVLIEALEAHLSQT